jgi:hypothetical protein
MGRRFTGVIRGTLQRGRRAVRGILHSDTSKRGKRGRGGGRAKG